MKPEELEQMVKQVYFYCKNKNPNGLYPTEDIDLIEFAQKLIAVYEANRWKSAAELLRPKEHQSNAEQNSKPSQNQW